jgi:hypothetical protein
MDGIIRCKLLCVADISSIKPSNGPYFIVRRDHHTIVYYVLKTVFDQGGGDNSGNVRFTLIVVLYQYARK